MQEAELAKEKMHGRLACGRPLVVRLAGEKYLTEPQQRSLKVMGSVSRGTISSSSLGSEQSTSKSAKIAAIKSKLKDLEGESSNAKKLRSS